jgi:preprotein translocase subunit SecE
VGSIPSWPAKTGVFMAATKKSSASRQGYKDTVVWSFAGLIVLFALYCNMKYQAVALPVKLLVGMVVVVLFCLLALLTERGKFLFVMLKESRQELHKIVWPQQQETLQTTIVVVIFVMIVALLLWLLDFWVMSLVNYMLGIGL